MSKEFKFLTEHQEKILLQITKNFTENIKKCIETSGSFGIDISERLAILLLLSQLKLFHCTRCEHSFETKPIFIKHLVDGLEPYPNNLGFDVQDHFLCPKCGLSEFVLPYYTYREHQLLEHMQQLEVDKAFNIDLVAKQKQFIDPIVKVLQENDMNFLGSPTCIPSEIEGRFIFFRQMCTDYIKLQVENAELKGKLEYYESRKTS